MLLQRGSDRAEPRWVKRFPSPAPHGIIGVDEIESVGHNREGEELLTAVTDWACRSGQSALSWVKPDLTVPTQSWLIFSAIQVGDSKYWTSNGGGWNGRAALLSVSQTMIGSAEEQRVGRSIAERDEQGFSLLTCFYVWQWANSEDTTRFYLSITVALPKANKLPLFWYQTLVRFTKRIFSDPF